MKLKTLLKESNAWDRKFGEPLPTLEDTRKAYKLKQEELSEKVVKASDKDVKAVAKALDKLPELVSGFVNKYKDLDADDLMDVIESGSDRRRNSLMVMAAMNGNSRALRKLDDLLGFL